MKLNKCAQENIATITINNTQELPVPQEEPKCHRRNPSAPGGAQVPQEEPKCPRRSWSAPGGAQVPKEEPKCPRRSPSSTRGTHVPHYSAPYYNTAICQAVLHVLVVILEYHLTLCYNITQTHAPWQLGSSDRGSSRLLSILVSKAIGYTLQG